MKTELLDDDLINTPDETEQKVMPLVGDTPTDLAEFQLPILSAENKKRILDDFEEKRFPRNRLRLPEQSKANLPDGESIVHKLNKIIYLLEQINSKLERQVDEGLERKCS